MGTERGLLAGHAEAREPSDQDARRVEVIELGDIPAAESPALAGSKAAALAKAAADGLPVLPGVVLTTMFSREVDGGAELCGHPAVRAAFEKAGGAGQSLVVRSSSPVEDQAGSSMAGQFDSVIGTTGIEEFEAGVQAVLASRRRAGASGLPIAVLVQPLVEPVVAGVAFGVDPVTGRADRRIVTAVAGQPAPLVAGEVDGSRYILDERAKVVGCDRNHGPRLDPSMLRRVALLAARAAEVFGAPHDIEWAVDHDDALWLLQSRPVTSEDRGTPSGPVYGPGPVAETFPEALTELEQDLWVPPLREGIRHAVLLAGAATPAQLAHTDIVVVLDGRVAMDLRLAGELVPARRLLHKLNPLPGARKLRSAWRVGRLRAALPHLAEDLLDRVDHDLEAVPALDSLTNRQLIALIHRGRDVLRSLHAHEILMGMLTDRGCGRLTGASVALRVLSEARADGLDDETILQRSPVVLALTAPEIRPVTALPRGAAAPDIGQSCAPGSNSGVTREALRLRIRWIHELTGRAAWSVGERLREAGSIPEADSIRHLRLDDVEAIVTRRAVTLPRLTEQHRHRTGEPLPACFQVSDRGRPITFLRSRELGGGTGGGGGVGSGPVTLDVTDPPTGSVLVTRTLAPGLGPLLPQLNGIVAETGSVLSHLAILARELGVPIVVGYPGAMATFDAGMVVSVDGGSGDVTVVEQGS